MPRFQWVGLTALVVACGGRSLLYEAPLAGDAGSSGDATGSSSGIESSSGTTSSSGIGSSTGSGSSGGSSSGSSSGSSTSSGSSSGGIEAGLPACNAPAPSVPPSEVLPYVNVVQMKGACMPSDISGFITACDSAPSTTAACDMWYQGASPTCLSCLGSADAGISRTGGLDWDYQGDFIGANLAGCLAIVDGNTSCASAYENAVQCLAASGCLTCTDQASFQMCETTIFATGGACHGYIATYESACAADMADGGAFMGGPCSDDTEVLSVICGNGSGDGG